jgi:hypothetical protein
MLFIGKEEIISVSEFIKSCEIERELAFENIELNLIEKNIDHLKKNKAKYMLLIYIIAMTVDLSGITVFATDTAAIDKAGMEILNLIRKVGYWVGIISCMKDVVKEGMRGHSENIGSIVIMYLMGFGVLYFLPWAFDLIKGIF